MNEIELVKWIGRQRGVEGLGDDCAILPGGRGSEILVTTDMLIEDVHFRRRHAPELVGHLALARGLSDIAAMGGIPSACLLSLALPKWTTDDWVQRFYAGLLKLARRHKTPLAGGDISHSVKLTADIVVIGECPRQWILRRGGARPGDGIYVSGGLGGAGVRKYEPVAFEPRIALGHFLSNSFANADWQITACMDITDGLALDLHRLCVESKVAAVIDRPLPVAPGATLKQALSAGEDYELLFTGDGEIPEWHEGVPLTRIGTIAKGRPGAMTLFGQPLEPRGYDHLKKKQAGRGGRGSR